MLRLHGKPGWPAIGLIALLMLSLVTGCADFARMAGLDPQMESGSDRGSRNDEESARRDKQLEEMAQKLKEMSETVDRNSKVLAALAEKLAATDPGADPRQPRPRRPGAARAETNAECVWIGQRTITVLLNDDLIAAEGFTRLYGDFQCPMEHLAQAFACAVPAAQQKDRAQLEAPAQPKPGETTEQAALSRREAQLAAADRRDKRIAACWSNPRTSSPQ